MKSITINVAREQRSMATELIKAAAIRAARTVFNPWTLSAIGVAIALTGIVLFHEIIFKTGATIAGVFVSVVLIKEFISEIKEEGGKR